MVALAVVEVARAAVGFANGAEAAREAGYVAAAGRVAAVWAGRAFGERGGVCRARARDAGAGFGAGIPQRACVLVRGAGSALEMRVCQHVSGVVRAVGAEGAGQATKAGAAHARGLGVAGQVGLLVHATRLARHGARLVEEGAVRTVLALKARGEPVVGVVVGEGLELTCRARDALLAVPREAGVAQAVGEGRAAVAMGEGVGRARLALGAARAVLVLVDGTHLAALLCNVGAEGACRARRARDRDALGAGAAGAVGLGGAPRESMGSKGSRSVS